MLMTGRILQLGEHSGRTLDAKADILAENNTVALASALVLTIQFAHLLAFNDEDFDKVGHFWGNATSTKTWGDVMEEVSIPCQICLATIQALALVYAIHANCRARA
jgi:hypothetical protein